MSTTLKTHKSIATLTKTITHFYDESFGSEVPEIKKLGNSLHEFIMNVDKALGGGNGFLEKSLFEKKLFEHLSTINLREFIDAYPEEQNEPGFVDSHNQQTKKIRGKLDDLESLAAPFNAQNVGRLQAMIDSMLHGFNDIDKQPIAKALNQLGNNLARHSLLLHPEMPSQLPEYEKVMEHFMSVQSYGDQHLGLVNGFRSSIEALETHGYDRHRNNRRFYANDVLARAVSDFLHQHTPVRIFPNGSETDAQMFSFKDLSGIVARVQADIPNHGRESVFVVGKVLNEMNDWFDRLSRSDFKRVGDGGTMAHHVDQFKETFSNVVQRYNNLASVDLEGYQKHWESSQDKEHRAEYEL